MKPLDHSLEQIQVRLITAMDKAFPGHDSPTRFTRTWTPAPTYSGKSKLGVR